jgi:hypothetical protein
MVAIIEKSLWEEYKTTLHMFAVTIPHTTKAYFSAYQGFDFL